MQAIAVIGKGSEARLELGEVGAPEPGPDELRIDIAASAVNRADLLQRRGLYPPPPGASPVLGLECAGVVERVGGRVRGFAPRRSRDGPARRRGLRRAGRRALRAVCCAFPTG